MFVLKTTVEEDVLEHIRDVVTPKEAWDTLSALFSKKNDSKLQLLENELLSMSQRDMTVSQYFHKVKTTCREIVELDPESRIGDARMKRIIIHGLKPEFRSFVAAVQGWATQPSLVEFENLLAGQEALTKQMGAVTIKADEEALYAEKGKGKYRSQKNNRYKKNSEKSKSHEGEKKCRKPEKGEQSEEKQKNNHHNKRFPFKCYNCGRKGHMARNCQFESVEEGNAATSQEEEVWDAEAMYAQVEDAQAYTATTESKRDRLDEWIVDSGCSNHMTGEHKKLKDPVSYGGSRVVVIADNSRLKIANVGDVVFRPENNSEELKLEHVYHVPGMKKNLLSVSQLASAGHYVLFGPEDVKVFTEFESPSQPILKGCRADSIYVMSAETAYVEKTKRNQNVDLWHMRLSHVSFDKLDMMMKKQMVRGLPQLEVRKDVVCAGCQYGKAHQQPFERSGYTSKAPLELVHSDVFGPVKKPSVKGMKYMVTFIDDYSRYVWVYFMVEKSEVFAKFKEFKAEAERETQNRLCCLRSDNGGEYLATEFGEFLKAHKIKRQLTCPNTPQQNGVSERKNRHLGEICRSIIHDKNVPGHFWAEAMKTAAYVINRIPQQSLDYVSPFEKLLKIKPNVNHLRVFGCVCYVFIPNHLRSKMEKKAIRCIFVGYDQERKGWRCCDPNSGKCYVSRNVVFDENSSWWSENHETLPDSETLQEEIKSSRVRLNVEDNDFLVDSGGIHVQDQEVQQPSDPLPVNEVTNGDDNNEVQNVRRSSRIRKPNPRYANAALVEESVIEPDTYDQAATKCEWVSAMEEEFAALIRNETWDLVPRPVDIKPVSCKWVFKLKRNTDGSICMYKARLVARGFSQQYGLDYEDTFSPVAKLTTIRVLLALAASKGWKLWQMDVSNAFLYGDLDHTIHMDQPRGFESKDHPSYVCKLKKALYGLKQSPRAWFGKMAEFLEHNGYSSTTADASLFVKKFGSKVALILVYVDDLIITGDLEEMVTQLKENLCTRFHMKDLGRLKHFLGLELSYDDEGIILHQRKYCCDLLKRFEMVDCKPAVTPMDTNTKLFAEVGRELEDATVYRKMVGSLIYLTLTRPDIAFPVGVLSRFMQHPRKPHLGAARRVLRYIKATLNYGVKFKREPECKLMGFCDADYAGDVNTRRSTTGYVFMLGSSVVSWCSKRQPTVSLSTTEAEYRAAAVAAQESVWLIQLLKDLNQEVNYSIPLMCDNMSSIKLAENPTFHARTKHIEVHYHFIREKVLKDEIDLQYVNTTKQVADLLTKGLASAKLIEFSKMMGMVEVDVERE
ncbi:hypothetical protein L1887_12232 [Cichorium endivia]|nr:hypothetical protein L1887_12232 [Cichorium endivia]